MVKRDLVLRAKEWIKQWLGRIGNNPLVREGAPFLGLYWFYSLIRWFVAYDGPYEAFSNAFRIIRAEDYLGIFIEPNIQQDLITHALPVVYFANWFYTFGYFPILILAVVGLYRVDRERYHTFKLTFLLGLGFALVCFSLFPLAPPRMLTVMGFVDTQRVFGSNLYNKSFTVSFYNPYAAMPSLHFGWALLVGVMARTFKRRVLRLLGVVYPACMAFTVIVTGHHFFLDILGGALVVGLAYGLVKLFSRVRREDVVWSAKAGMPEPPLFAGSGTNPWPWRTDAKHRQFRE